MRWSVLLFTTVFGCYAAFSAFLFVYNYDHFHLQVLMWDSELPLCPHNPLCVE